jgi:metalloendopeptidase OMA1, mitochondrial
MKRIFSFWTFGLICTSVAWLGLTGCETVPETGRRQINFIGADQEVQLGLSSFDQTKKQVPISRDAAGNALLQRVGKRIAAVAPLPKAQWEFVLFESKEANAFCLPGGKVGVYTGILPVTRDEAGLATVIGHEVAHAVAHHGAERISESMLLELGGQAVGAAAQNSKYQSYVTAAYGLGSQVGRELPHSRTQESEADEMGLYYMARAGYNPEASVAFWQRFAEFNQKQGGSQGLWFLRTHPLDEKRIADLQSLLPKAKAQFRPSAP